MSDVNTQNEFLEKLGYGQKRLILSIDGGGTMGLLPLYCLQKLEELAGKPCYEIFDFYAGTSTGAIIAGALACRMKASEIIELYKTFIKQIFPPRPPITFWGVLVRAIVEITRLFGSEAIGPQMAKEIQHVIANDLKYMYNHQKLWELIRERLHLPEDGEGLVTLEELYEDSKAHFDRPKRLLITLKDVERSETLFAVNAGPGAAAFADMPLAYAVLGTAVAPVYLEPFRVWIDGGVGSYHNPCYRAVVEAAQYFTGEAYGQNSDRYTPQEDDDSYRADNLVVFSFGTGHRANFKKYAPDVSKMIFFDWMRYVIGEQLDEANDGQVLLTQEHFEAVDFRRYQLTLDLDLLAKPVAEGGIARPIGPKDRELLAHLNMASADDDVAELMVSLGEHWAEAIGADFSKPHYPLEKTAPYWPPGAVPLRIPPHVRGTVPAALIAYLNANLPPLPGYMNKKVSELRSDPRYQ